MPRVFAVQQPTGRDPYTRAIVPSMDLSPAEQYGEMVFICREFENPFDDTDVLVSKIRSALEEHDIDEEDWILLVGNPTLIAVVAAVVAEYVPALRMLQWNRARHEYAPVIVQLSELTDSHGPE